MSDFKNEKDYDLDYFNSHKDTDSPDSSSLMPGDDFNEEVEFDINAFTKQSDEVSE